MSLYLWAAKERMKSTDIIRAILDLIDHIECRPDLEVKPLESDPIQTGVDTNRFKQIFDLLSNQQPTQYDNSPAEVVAKIDSVTTHAGGGWNGPKNPADMKADSISMYPNYLHKPGE